MRRLVFDFIVPVLHLNPRLQQINTRVCVGDVLLCGLIKGNIPGCCCCVPPPPLLSLYSLSHTVMRNGSREAGGTSTAQFIIHVIHTKASCSEQTPKISISPPSLLSRMHALSRSSSSTPFWHFLTVNGPLFLSFNWETNSRLWLLSTAAQWPISVSSGSAETAV